MTPSDLALHDLQNEVAVCRMARLLMRVPDLESQEKRAWAYVLAGLPDAWVCKWDGVAVKRERLRRGICGV
jgi:hypothetical protein